MTDYEQTEQFATLRQVALTAAERKHDSDSPVVALLMETGTADAVASLSIIADGSVNFIFSNGGGILGADEHPQVQHEGLELLAASRDFLGSMELTEQFPLPAQGYTRFYAVMDDGVRTTECPEADLDYEKHALSPLFFQAHGLISYLRMVGELSRAIKNSGDRNYGDY